jgi:type IV secretory pathway VirB2 component (pilin)
MAAMTSSAGQATGRASGWRRLLQVIVLIVACYAASVALNSFLPANLRTLMQSVKAGE